MLEISLILLGCVLGSRLREGDTLVAFFFFVVWILLPYTLLGPWGLLIPTLGGLCALSK